ncbi:hypothetical protein [Streptomyces tauricus]
MQEATDQTTPAAPPEARAVQPRDRQADAFDHAAALVAWYFRRLSTKPYSTELTEDFPIGVTAHLKYRDGQADAVLQFAEIAGVPVNRATTAFGLHLEVYVRYDSVLMRASTLVLHGKPWPPDEQSAPPNPPTDTTATAADETPDTIGMRPAPEAMPLGSSVVFAPGVTTAVDEDEARCVRCGCTENTPCQGGCAWIPNAQMIDLCSACATPEETAATGWKPAATDTPAGDR